MVARGLFVDLSGLGRAGQIAVGELVEQRAADRARCAFLAGAVHRHEQADVRIGEQPQIAVEPFGVAAVRDRPMPVDPLFVEAERHAVERADAGRLVIVHQLRRLGLQQHAAVVQMRHHELAHVAARRRQAAGGGRHDDFEGLGLVGHHAVAARHEGRERGRQRLAEARIFHAQRRKDVAVDIIVERFAAGALNDVSGQRGRIVGIGGRASRRKHPRGQRFARIILQRHHRLGITADQMADRFFKARGVRHDIAQRHRLALEGRNLEIEIGVHILVEVELAGFDKLHHGGPGKQLGHRTGAEQRRRGINRLARRDICKAIALLQHRAAAAHHDDNRTGNLAARERIGHETVEPRLDIGGVELGRARGRRRHGRRLLRRLGGDLLHRPLRGQRDGRQHSQSYHQLAKETHRFIPLIRRAARHACSEPRDALPRVSNK